ncbi:MAG: 16S rRNA (cytidine(1402)-2'-O)-methyltransferase [Candidatus Omnitrophica bacterium]|nr:16S rRNA (cytidine(1402)-2'-O)-methyltransferase [Candidatus Omnitrophota bacterium]MCM8830949.1 16S rRNA (cytidine(1402)-2'-O)-methyltransferase [Candidatus Omnitrophota bacterium]
MLYIVSTPIGNLEDITLRALKILSEVDFILAEDTRKAGLLLKHFNIKKPLVSFYEHNEVKKIPWVIEQLKQEKHIALVSNAGTPTISDPGYKLICACRKEKLPITAIPGPCSLISAVALSSLPKDKFIFLGYLPKKRQAKLKLFHKMKEMNFTFVFFESPLRLLDTLLNLKEEFGNRKVTVAKELTKKFEEVIEVNIDEAIEYFKKDKPRGEFTILVERLN